MSGMVLLTGRPNTGKTTLFNALTGGRQRVANFHGTTVEQAVGTMRREKASLDVVDLPGTPSILPSGLDEQAAFDYISECVESGDPFTVVCVGEACNLEGDLAFALSLRNLGYPVTLVVNMIDEAARNGVLIDYQKLESEVGIPVFRLCARTKEGLVSLEAHLATKAPLTGVLEPLDVRRTPIPTLRKMQDRAMIQAQQAAAEAVTHSQKGILRTISRSITLDRILFHPLAGPVILGVILFTVFQALFAWASPVMDLIDGAMTRLSDSLRPALGGGFLSELVCDGILAGISAVVIFVPQIAILFTLIGFLDQSGYLPRAGVMVDRLLRPFGLDGKVFLPFVSSFACAIPGVMSARTIGNEKKRLTAIFLAPLMTCSARLPVYTLIIGAFVPASLTVLGFNAQGLTMAGMYVFGVVMALLFALVLRSTNLYEAHPTPATVLPPFRIPQAGELGRYVWARCWHFLSRAGQVIFVVSILLWLAATFPRNPAAVAPLEARLENLRAASAAPENKDLTADLEVQIKALSMEKSFLGRLGKSIEPVFRPIGFDWRMSVGVISSMAAREVFVGTLATIYALSSDNDERLVKTLQGARNPDGSARYTLATAVSLLIFFAIAMQCISTIAIVRRETGGWKWPALQFASFFVAAYGLAWLGFRITSAFI